MTKTRSPLAIEQWGVCLSVYVCLGVYACVWGCVSVCVCVYVWMCVHFNHVENIRANKFLFSINKSIPNASNKVSLWSYHKECTNTDFYMIN